MVLECQGNLKNDPKAHDLMALNLRHKQIECVIRMLNLNQPLHPSGSANDGVYKIIIYDDICEKIIAPLMLVKDLQRQGVTLHLHIHKERLHVPAVAVYFLQATETNIKRIISDAYSKKENEMMMRGGIDWSDLLSVLKGKGTKMDKLRFAIIYLISLETINQAEVEAVEAALREAEVDTSAFQYVKWIKSLNVSLAASENSASRSNIIDWAEKLYGQSISAVTAGVKNLLSSDQLLRVARTVEALAEGKPNAETDSYLMLDPRGSKSTYGGSSHMKGPFREAIVFMVGGGNYIEYSSLQELLQRQEMVKNIIYGATEILTGTEFVEQLALLGQKMGLK